MKKRFVTFFVTLFILLTTFVFNFSAYAEVSFDNKEQMTWLFYGDFEDVKGSTESLQKYRIPLDDIEKYSYYLKPISGGGYCQSGVNKFSDHISYVIGSSLRRSSSGYMLQDVVFTRVDLILPDLNRFAGFSEHGVSFSVESIDKSLDDIDVSNGKNFIDDGAVTSVGGFPAKSRGGIHYDDKGKQNRYEKEIYVDIYSLMPWMKSIEGREGCIIAFHVNAISSNDEIYKEAQQIVEFIKSWKPAVTEPIVIAADPEALQESGTVKDKTDIEVDTPAKEESGEDGGTEIPAIIILGTLGAGAALAGAAGQGGEDDKKKRSQFKMYINKNFGSSLKKGAPPQDVFARIAEITPDGREIPRADLTEQIRVYSSDDSLIVKDGGMENGYRRAVVSVYDNEEQPPEGKVSFYFEGEGGSFTQNVIFNIAVPGIKFFQNNLTLPAGILDEPEFLPFEVSEMGDKYEIELSYNGEV